MSREIIDLTESPPPSEPIVIRSDADDSELAQGEIEARRPRKKRRKRVPTEDGKLDEGSAQASRNHSREKHADRENNFSSHQRSSSSERRRRSLSPQPRNRFTDIFFVDVIPVQVPASAKSTSSAHGHQHTPTGGDIGRSKLLLPEHVSVFGANDSGEGPVEIIGPTPNSGDEDEDFIEYLDYDDRNKGLVRYFDAIEEDNKPARFVCKNCGAEGEHRTIDCPVQICLTCGVRNEHSTRSCPISKTCYSCGMKGHINQNCPNRHNRERMDNYDDCDRCGASIHKTNECPTWWRMYEYVSDEKRCRILQAREEKKHFGLGQGGEGYIGGDECCYNCGGVGHWGDDCNEVPHVWDFPREPSAFSTHNTMSGPFFDPAAEPAQYQASYRDHGGDDKLPESWGINAPSNVGKQGRSKDRVKLEKRFREQEAASDPEDWFVNPANARSRGLQANAPLNRVGPHGSKKLVFGASMKEAGPQFQPSSIPERPKLIDRIHDGHGRSKHRSRQGEQRGPPHEKSPWRTGDDSSSRGSHYVSGKGQHYRDRDRDRGYRDRRRDGNRADRRDPGPRYTGGYAR